MFHMLLTLQSISVETNSIEETICGKFIKLSDMNLVQKFININMIQEIHLDE